MEGGSFTSSDESVVSTRDMSSRTSDGTECYSISAKSVGTATLTYTCEDGREYSHKINVKLPDTALYTQQQRSEETWVKDPKYDPVNGTVLWLINVNGYSASKIEKLTVKLGGNTYPEFTAEAIAREAEPELYDVKITMEPDADCDNSNSSQLLNIGYGYDGYSLFVGFITVMETPRLLYRPMTVDSTGSHFYEDSSLQLLTLDGLILHAGPALYSGCTMAQQMMLLCWTEGN